MEPLFAYAYAEPPREPIRRHSRPRGRCEGMFWRPFNPKDIGRYLLADPRRARTLAHLNRSMGQAAHVAAAAAFADLWRS